MIHSRRNDAANKSSHGIQHREQYPPGRGNGGGLFFHDLSGAFQRPTTATGGLSLAAMMMSKFHKPVNPDSGAGRLTARDLPEFIGGRSRCLILELAVPSGHRL
jgi:hypothetical protein